MLKRRQIRAIKRAFHKLFKRTWKFVNTVSKSVVDWFLRTVLLIGIGKQRQANPKAGFVLPTVAMMLLVISLVVAAILLRTGSRTNQVIGAREEQVIYNAATPAIERAKAKLEFLFTKDNRRPTNGPASDKLLLSLLLNNENDYFPTLMPTRLDPDPYTFADEREAGRLDINNDGRKDPAWTYETDVDGDGRKERIVYSINLRRRDDNGIISVENNTEIEKAKKLVVRNGPINTISSTDSACSIKKSPSEPEPPPEALVPTREGDWFETSGTATISKTFQVDAIVISNKQGTSRTVATLEFQQDRQLDKGNKWGAWFRYDLEIYPGDPFTWNGAMYTAGNLLVSKGGDRGNFRGFLVSSEKSCIYGKDASEIVVLDESTRPGAQTGQGFQGQMGSGRLRTNTYTDEPVKFDVQEKGSKSAPRDTSVDTTFKTGTDSVKSGSPEDIALDPVKLFTEDLSVSRNGTNRNLRDENWEKGLFVDRGRIYNNVQDTPFVDDTYRADDRYGPKPKYDQKESRYWLDTGSKRNGQPIPASETKLISNSVDTVADPNFRTLGLDGYWERRAWADGLRIIVGQRLELGNPFGWVNSDLNANGNRNELNETDPLYPLYRVNQTIPHEQQQRRTLRDNLAAVQATVVYHHNSGLGNPAGDFPLSCIATTAHPGTQQTDIASRDFRWKAEYDYPGAPNRLVSDFFNGKGTNGWEFTVHSQAQYSGGPLRDALQNLANLAGDPEGAFPPQQQGGEVNPNPYLTMWGDFSNLRRALNTPYSNLSIADKSYLHTAGCSLGMLAYNVKHFNDYSYAVDTTRLNSLENALRRLSDGVNTNGEVNRTTGQVYNSTGTLAKTVLTPVSPDVYIQELTGADKNAATLVAMKQQIERDRASGFASSTATTTASFDHDNDTTTPEIQLTGLACDPNTLFSSANVAGGARALGVLCPVQPKFPSLYYLFPTSNFNNRTGPVAQPSGGSAEPYIANTNSIPLQGQFTSVAIDQIALAPKGDGNWTGGNNNANGNWFIPTDGAQPSTDTKRTLGIFTPNAPLGTTTTGSIPNFNRYVSIIDSAFYDGREAMTVRALNVDLNRLRSTSMGGNNNTLLPRSGIVYAFREDAVREDAIIRPNNGNKTDVTNPNDPKDPATTNNNISPKPVDFYPDPDRRPYGFRLRNGQDLRRKPGGGGEDNENPRGITFVSDNPVYIQGNFNFHSTNGTENNIEEFDEKLGLNEWNDSNFYGRRNLDKRFARVGSGNDTWRPSEILSDALYILSDSFTEGYVDLGITTNTANTSITPSGRYSFRALNAPSNSNQRWLREDGAVTNPTNINLPIKVARNGNPLVCNVDPTPTGSPCPLNQIGNPSGSFRSFGTNYTNDVNKAVPTRVNSILVSGIIPTRTNQQNGGFHNFPRMLENWETISSAISGSFVQLNFSTYATGPYNQNVWEPGQNPNGNNFINYYVAPTRSWGYDVGLQYAPAGPLSQRFVSSSPPRSEFYRDLKVDDPYICALRRGLNRKYSNIDAISQVECRDF